MEGAVRSGHAAAMEALLALRSQNGSSNGGVRLGGATPDAAPEQNALIAGGSG
jgi:hypothetical protein